MNNLEQKWKEYYKEYIEPHPLDDSICKDCYFQGVKDSIDVILENLRYSSEEYYNEHRCQYEYNVNVDKEKTKKHLLKNVLNGK